MPKNAIMIELKLNSVYPREIIACDEVGRGPLCGPVVAGALRVVVHSKKELKALLAALTALGIDDSKKLSEKNRFKILEILNLHETSFRTPAVLKLGSSEVKLLTWDMDHEVIDRENILGASLRAMKEAALELSEMKEEKSLVLIDGNKSFRWDKESAFEEVTIIQGDSKSKLIGLASILAKFVRDEHMKKMHELYPVYGMDKHAGYPTETHRKALEIHGPSPIHRKTFKGVREFLRD